MDRNGRVPFSSLQQLFGDLNCDAEKFERNIKENKEEQKGGRVGFLEPLYGRGRCVTQSHCVTRTNPVVALMSRSGCNPQLREEGGPNRKQHKDKSSRITRTPLLDGAFSFGMRTCVCASRQQAENRGKLRIGVVGLVVFFSETGGTCDPGGVLCH